MGTLHYLHPVAEEVAVLCAAEDPELRAFYELRAQGYTDAVSVKRADILEDYPEDLLQSEVQRDYKLSATALARAVHICRQDIQEAQVA